METQNSLPQLRDGKNLSIWQNYHTPRVNRVDTGAPKSFDTLIVGAGITGLTTALLLQKQGHKCAVAEASNLGFGTTGGTSAHLNTFLDASYPEIESDFGENAAKLMAKASSSMIGFIRANLEGFNIDADFEYKKGYLFSENKEQSKTLESILMAAKKAGVEVEQSAENGVPLAFEKSICFNNQAQFHPLKYVSGLLDAFMRNGGAFYENTFIEKTAFKDGVHDVFANGRQFKVSNLVYATHIPPGINHLSLRNAPYRSYVLGVKLRSNSYPDCLSYDMQEPYHYFRSHILNGQQYLIVGGEDHKTGHESPEKAFENLEKYTRKHFDVASIEYRWSSQYYVPVDGLPYIGKLPGGDPATYVATGFNGNGMIFGSLSGLIISDLILGKENEYQELLSPSRMKPVAGFREFVKENADVAYHFIADRFGSQVMESVKELSEDVGKIVSFEGERLAIYKDGRGALTALNPVCTHAGCIVNWNNEEKSWDCPCHGARFSASGKVITGPARLDLEVVPLPEELKAASDGEKQRFSGQG